MSDRHQLVLSKLDVVDDGVGALHGRTYRVLVGQVNSIAFLIIKVLKSHAIGILLQRT